MVDHSGCRLGALLAVWLQEGGSRITKTRNDRKSQASGANHARRQSVDRPTRTPSLASHDPVRAVQIRSNLPRRMKMSGPNQLWIADIT